MQLDKEAIQAIAQEVNRLQNEQKQVQSARTCANNNAQNMQNKPSKKTQAEAEGKNTQFLKNCGPIVLSIFWIVAFLALVIKLAQYL